MKSYLNLNDVIPFNRDEADIFARCTRADMQNIEVFTEESIKHFGNANITASVLEKKLVWGSPEVKITVPLARFLVYLSEDALNDISMWAYTMNRIYKKNPKVLTMNDWTDYFPNGYPTKESRKNLWNSQEYAKGNLINLIENWK